MIKKLRLTMNHIQMKASKLLMILCASVWLASCTSDKEPIPDNTIDVTIWSGPMTTFTKAAGADPTVEANQDRITANVWITRGNSGGQIFNINTETAANKDGSPEGTMWAEGDIANAATLNFRPFRAAVGSPKDVVGKNLVLFIPAENVMMTVRFTAWSTGRAGGFAYMRSTP